MTEETRDRLPLTGWDLLIIGVLIVVTVLLAGGLLPDDAHTGPAIVPILGLQSAIMVGAVWAVAIWWRGASWASLGLRPTTLRWCVRAALIALLTVPAVSLINLGVNALMHETFSNPQVEFVAGVGTDWMGRLGMIAVGGIVVPVVEEITFRGLLYGWLRDRIGLVAGIIVSALIFASIHAIPPLIPALALQGAVLAIVYQRSGSLWPPIVLHAVFNSIMMFGLFAAMDSGAIPSTAFIHP